MYNSLLILASGAEGEAPAGPTLFGLDPTFYVSLAMTVLVLVMLWKKVPGMIVGGLDNKIAAIRLQLDEAKALRAEAEALRNEYSAKIAGAEKDAESMMENARKEADGILEKAEEDSKAMIARRKKMAEDKIAAAERDAVDDVRNRAAMAATAAAEELIAKKHTNAADAMLADEIIAGM
ncbi:F0F1 ATP synthase subunit B [Pontixanthobacter gangjinensis]|uniref:ATP synthase subunit b n=1 Tax=Pontixanthobacter gangjinensis TaxID=1028742 RepID=A0A6I4SLY9_9SPHN|nr:hypothetical protein [Pontixanthobacter gangjinensis]MXO56755.1 hypothetical protein [Pontixanthobacter gangjinensis]